MVHNWITILNIFLFFIIGVSQFLALSIPGEEIYDDAALIGEDDDRTELNALGWHFKQI